MKISVQSNEFNLELDTEKVDSFSINNEVRSIFELDYILQTLAVENNIQIKKLRISNKYLRAIVKKDKDVYHVLEKPAGIYDMDCRAQNGTIKTVKLYIPNTVMVVRLTYTDGKYISRGERLFHTKEPVRQDLSNTIYAWGASNVYPDMRICWGSGKLPSVDNNTSHKLIDEFYCSIKNKDLIKNNNINWDKMNTTTVYKISLDDVQKSNMTIAELINNKIF